jgi:GR25 family glycosyltransferase involved in LPS biosynthesis
MEKDVDRLKKVDSMLKKEGIGYERFNAINGKDRNKYKEHISGLCQLLCTDGMIGCGLSHYFIWKKVVENELNSVLVFEDDIFFANNYQEVFNKAFSELPKDWDIFYLGCDGLCDKNMVYSKMTLPLHLFKKKVKRVELNHLYIPEYPLATHSYAVSYSGCVKLLQSINKVNFHIDSSIAMIQNKLNAYACAPDICFQNDDESTITNITFPKSINRLLSTMKDNKNTKYDYIMTVPLMKGVNWWTVVFFLSGMIAKRNKYIRNAMILLLIIECNLKNIFYNVAVMMFIIGYKIL